MAPFKKIRVQAVRRDGFQGYFCARRFIPSANPIEIEVFDLPEGVDPPEVDVELPDPSTGGTRKDKRPDPYRIGKNSYAQLIEDSMVSVKEGDELELSEALVRLQAVTVERDALAAQKVELEGKVRGLEGDLAAARAALEAARKTADESAPPAAPPSPSAESPSKAQARK